MEAILQSRVSALIAIILISAVVFVICTVFYANSQNNGPYFLNTEQVLLEYEPLKIVNEQIAHKNTLLESKMRTFEDSLAKIMDSLSVRRGAEEELLELLNLESNVFRHKQIDSVNAFALSAMKTALDSFDSEIARFCKKEKINVLFGSNANTVIYGTNTKSDITLAFLKFMENK